MHTPATGDGVSPGSLSVLAFAFTAGALTFLAPCAYPLLPGYVSYYLGASPAAVTPDVGRRLWRAVAVSLVVSLGFIGVYGVLAVIVITTGSRLLANVVLLELVVGLILVGLGLAMLLDRAPAFPMLPLPARRRTPGGYLAFGVIYAFAAAGCSAPIFAGIVGYGLTLEPQETVAAIAAYVAGMSAFLIGVTLVTALGRQALLTQLTRRRVHIHRLSGVLLLAAGVAQLLYFVRVGGLHLLVGA